VFSDFQVAAQDSDIIIGADLGSLQFFDLRHTQGQAFTNVADVPVCSLCS